MKYLLQYTISESGASGLHPITEHEVEFDAEELAEQHVERRHEFITSATLFDPLGGSRSWEPGWGWCR